MRSPSMVPSLESDDGSVEIGRFLERPSWKTGLRRDEEGRFC